MKPILLILAALPTLALAKGPGWDSGSGKTGFQQALEQAGIKVPDAEPAVEPSLSGAACPDAMAPVPGFCIDRWEATVVDKATRQDLSPYLTPNPKKSWPGAAWQYNVWVNKPSPAGYPMPAIPAFQQTGAFTPVAVSRPGVYPQGFMNHEVAALACENAGKRLCTRDEWYKACVGPDGPQPANGRYPVAFPYGPTFEPGKCNYDVAHGHPLPIVGRSNSQLDDPRLMLAEAGGQRLLAKTGDYSQCTNAYGVYDMVGNQDEVVSDLSGDHMIFVGGFYSRGSGPASSGCASAISAHHASLYMDYSIGFRCCLSR